jgi:threonyl-tRNA synthetase
MKEIKIAVPEGEKITVSKETTLGEVASLAGIKEAIAGKIDGNLVDLSFRLTVDTRVAFITPSSPEALEILRHSAAHVLAQAVCELFPGVKVGIGPAIEDGFYYDFLKATPFTKEDLEKIEKRMKDIVAADLPIKRKKMSKDEAIKLFSSMGQDLKAELIEERGGEMVSLYEQGGFIDFCRGPHLPSTGFIKAIKVIKSSGAYWKGDERNPMLQRIYGTAFFSREELEGYLNKLEEAKKRDHRLLGKELELFSIPEEGGPGLVYWHPKGAIIYQIIEDFWKKEHLARGYQLVKTPHIARAGLWKASGHFQFYREFMYTLSIEDEEYVLKPMNCPLHILIYKSKRRSYRELPLRFAEMGTVYRYERSGVLHGTLRVRGFTQDDAHIFCTPEQLPEEILAVLDLTNHILSTFGFDKFDVELSVRDPANKNKYAGSDEEWAQAEAALEAALDKQRLSYRRMEGEAVFYGPKIDIKLIDSLGRGWQATTVQFDFNLPQRLAVNYIGADSKEHPVFMVHRAILGSLERFIGTLIEHYKGAFPLWLSPVQVVVIPIADRHHPYARKVFDMLKKEGFRVELDGRSEKVGYKIREAQLARIPFMLIVGDKEETQGNVSVRNRVKGDTGKSTLKEFISEIKDIIDKKALAP